MLGRGRSLYEILLKLKDVSLVANQSFNKGAESHKISSIINNINIITIVHNIIVIIIAIIVFKIKYLWKHFAMYLLISELSTDQRRYFWKDTRNALCIAYMKHFSKRKMDNEGTVKLTE